MGRKKNDNLLWAGLALAGVAYYFWNKSQTATTTTTTTITNPVPTMPALATPPLVNEPPTTQAPITAIPAPVTTAVQAPAPAAITPTAPTAQMQAVDAVMNQVLDAANLAQYNSVKGSFPPAVWNSLYDITNNVWTLHQPMTTIRTDFWNSWRQTYHINDGTYK
jgi:hypothetical protein